MSGGGDYLDRVASILREIRSAPERERDALLRERCGDDDGLMREVEGMLRAETQVGEQFLNRPLVTRVQGQLPTRAKRIGPWAVDEPLGAGGMGAVFRGHRADGAFEAEVAIKFISAGLFDPNLRGIHDRFVRERQILATLDHPNISRLLDGGITDDGQPYFVMELVHGRSMMEYCDASRATLNDRLRLFDEVCQAVQHAHGNLIVHRDLKPSNILVDESGRPRLLDFGIASILRDRVGPGTITATAERRFTPQYAAPEQVCGEAVTVATDVYSLGMILYELLTGARPYEVSSGYTPEDARTICEAEPPRPSRRLDAQVSGPTTDIASIARARSLDPASLRRSLKGDLDYIIMTALRKEPARRYATVEALREDLRRYQRGMPVAARPDSWGYRTRKFVSRHRVPMVAATAASIALTAAAGLSTMFALREAGARHEAEVRGLAEATARLEAERQARIAHEVNEFLNKDLLAAADPHRSGDRDITIREVLDAASSRIAGRFTDEPLVEAAIRTTLGVTYNSLSEYESAEGHLSAALQLRRDTLGEDDPETLAAMRNLGQLYSNQGRYEEARDLLEAALDACRQNFEPGHVTMLASLHDLTLLCLRMSEFDAAEALLLEALEIRAGTGEEFSVGAIEDMSQLALLRMRQTRFAEAEELWQSVLAARTDDLGEDHPNSLMAAHNLASVRWRLGRHDEAEDLYLDTLEHRRRVLGPEHRETVITMNNIGLVRWSAGRYEEAEPLLMEVIDIQDRTLGPMHPAQLTTKDNLAKVYLAMERWEDAERLFTYVLKHRRAALGEEHRDTLVTLNNLALLHDKLEQRDRAEEFFAQLTSTASRSLPADHAYLAVFYANHARCLFALERYDEAEELLVEAIRIAEAAHGSDHSITRRGRTSLLRLYEETGRGDDARRLRSR